MTTAEATVTDRELVLSRTIAASPETIYRAWTDSTTLPKWWGPHGMTTPGCEMDLQPGGIMRTVMRDPNGTEYLNTGVFLELIENKKIVFTDAFKGGWEPVPSPFMVAIITLEDLGGGMTECTAKVLHWTVENREQHEQMGFYTGWGEMFERLETLVTTQ